MEDSLKETNEIKELIEAKDFFSKIVNLNKETETVEDNKNIFQNKLHTARKCLLDRNYEEAIEMYLFIINKDSTWKDGLAKNELLSLFSF